MKQRHGEQGGVLSFVIIGTILALLLVGGILLAKQQARTVRTTGDASTSQNQSGGQGSTDGNNGSVGSDSGSTSDSGSSNSGNGSSSSSGSDEDTTGVATTGPSSTDTIPSAGPSGIVAGILVLSTLSAGLYAYAQSGKRLRRSALK